MHQKSGGCSSDRKLSPQHKNDKNNMLYIYEYLCSTGTNTRNKQGNNQSSYVYTGESKQMFTHTSTWEKKTIKQLANLPTKDRQTCIQPGSAGRTEVTTALERLKLSTQNKTDRNNVLKGFRCQMSIKLSFFLFQVGKVLGRKKTKHMGLEAVGQAAIRFLHSCDVGGVNFCYFKVG